MWSLLDGNLYYNDDYVESYNIDEDNEEFNKTYLEHMQYQIEISKNDKYCAIFAKNGLHCDIFTHDNEEELVLCKRRNTYRKENIEFIVKFIENPITNETYLITNEQHSVLSFYNLDKKNDRFNLFLSDIFMNELKIINSKYMLLNGWIWTPMNIYLLFDIKLLFEEKKNYIPQNININDDDKIDSNGLYVKSLDKLIAFKDLHNDKYIIENLIILELYKKDNILKSILNKDLNNYYNYDISISKQQNLHNFIEDNIIKIECIATYSKRYIPYNVINLLKLESQSFINLSEEFHKCILLVKNIKKPIINCESIDLNYIITNKDNNKININFILPYENISINEEYKMYKFTEKSKILISVF
jgi:hypothetical protein